MERIWQRGHDLGRCERAMQAVQEAQLGLGPLGRPGATLVTLGRGGVGGVRSGWSQEWVGPGVGGSRTGRGQDWAGLPGEGQYCFGSQAPCSALYWPELLWAQGTREVKVAGAGPGDQWEWVEAALCVLRPWDLSPSSDDPGRSCSLRHVWKSPEGTERTLPLPPRPRPRPALRTF